MKYLFVTALVVLTCSCSTNSSQAESDSWNLLGGSYWKHGEMMSYDGYWVEAYKDTITGINLIVMVDKDNNNQITDSLKIAPLSIDTDLDYGSVQLNQQPERSLVALFRLSDSTFHTNILKAWKANSGTGKFEEIPTTGIRVENVKKHSR